MNRLPAMAAMATTVILLIACGGGSDSDDASGFGPRPLTDDDSNPFVTTDEPPATSDSQEVPAATDSESEPTADAIVGQELVGDLKIGDLEPRNGIDIRVTGFAVSEAGRPEISMRLDNSSGVSIFDATCTVAAIQAGNIVVDTARVRFARSIPIAAGERTINNTGTWFDLLNGFSDIVQINFNCDWQTVDSRFINLDTDPVQVDFAGYTTSQTGRPAVSLMMTNNSAITIYNASCGVKAKRGNTIVDVARLFFANLDDINPGEAAQDDGIWFELSSFDDFESEPFDLSKVECSYLVRR